MVCACDLCPMATLSASRKRLDPAYFIGSGKVSELKSLCSSARADVVVFGHDLSAAQMRNLESELGCRVTDRVMLIIEIFAKRARSFEGKLQVEIAKARIDLSKLAGYWTHLERQRSARGAVGGPGEKQIEIDRRLIQRKVSRLEISIDKYTNQARMHIRRRHRQGVPTVALVGYTNAGKSTLLNAMSGKSDAHPSSRMFETLDSLSRKIHLGDGRHAVMSDTVGFLRELPHDLVAAFRATLAEAVHADLIVHVVDMSSERMEREMQAVEHTLHNEIDAGLKPRLVVWNKCDLTGTPAEIRRDRYGRIEQVSVSAMRGEGLDLLRFALVEKLGHAKVGSTAGEFTFLS